MKFAMSFFNDALSLLRIGAMTREREFARAFKAPDLMAFLGYRVDRGRSRVHTNAGSSVV